MQRALSYPVACFYESERPAPTIEKSKVQSTLPSRFPRERGGGTQNLVWKISLTVALRESSFFRSENPKPSHQHKTQNRSEQEEALHDWALYKGGQRQNQQGHGCQ